MADEQFGAKLALVLKALTLSNGRFAADLEVDKSLVGRWVAGSVTPSAHNLSRLTASLAQRLPWLTLLDWDAPTDTLARRLGMVATAPPPAATAADPPSDLLHLPYGLLDAAARETARRASAYLGRWKMMRLVSSGRLIYCVDYALIRRRGDGMAFEMFADGHLLSGWVLILGNRLYALLADEIDDSFAQLMLNGVVGPQASRLDGMLTSCGTERHADAFSSVIVLDYEGELAGGPEAGPADFDWGRAAKQTVGKSVDPAGLPPEVVAALCPDSGPAALAAGIGDAIVRIPHGRSLSHGFAQARVQAA